MTNGDVSIPTLNLGGANAEDFKIVDESQIRYLFGGRYCSDEYIQVPDEKGVPKNVHRVTLELVCDHEQFIALMRASAELGKIDVKLV